MPDPLLFPVPQSIETARLLLRAFTPEDAPELHRALSESLAQLRAHLWHLPWVAEEQTLASAQIRCRRAAGNFALRTDLAFLAVEKGSGRLVGSVGLHRTDWALPKTEVGYWLRRGETGKGYATEAVLALTDWALHGLGAVRVELVTDEKNLGSRAVAERAGFALEGVLRHASRAPDGELRSHCLYARLPAAAQRFGGWPAGGACQAVPAQGSSTPPMRAAIVPARLTR